MITARALGIYMYLYSTGANIASESLSRVFKEGERAIGTALKELRDLGMIETKRVRIGGRIMTTSVLVEPDYWTAETAVLLKQSLQNSRLILIANSINKLTEYTNGVREEYKNKMEIGAEGMTDHFPDYDDLENYKQRAKKKKQEEYEAERKSNMDKRMTVRDPLNKAAWTPTDTTYEFAYRVHNMFHVKPWQVGNSRFRMALATFRKTYDTDGEIECVLMDMFFSSIAEDKSLNDPEKIWRMFIKKAPSMVQEARMRLVTDDDIVTAKVNAESTWKGL